MAGAGEHGEHLWLGTGPVARGCSINARRAPQRLPNIGSRSLSACRCPSLSATGTQSGNFLSVAALH
jgi:hypothetical protein